MTLEIYDFIVDDDDFSDTPRIEEIADYDWEGNPDVSSSEESPYGFKFVLVAHPSPDYIFGHADLYTNKYGNDDEEDPAETVTNTSQQEGDYIIYEYENYDNKSTSGIYKGYAIYFDEYESSAVIVDVTLQKEGGQGGTSSVSGDEGESMPSISTPTKPGFKFGGYYTARDGGGVQYYDENGDTTKDFDSSVKTLYAYWIELAEEKYSGGLGTSLSPYLISSFTDLQKLATMVNNGWDYAGTYFKQTTNITMSSSSWTPIGWSGSSSSSMYFAGHYDGGNYKISRMNITSGGNYLGLFGCVKGTSSSNKAEIKNVNISGKITSGLYMGGIAGYIYATNSANTYTDITNCRSDVEISGSESTGGIVGYAGNGVSITKCINFGKVSNNDLRSGGICGSLLKGGTMTDCINCGDVSSVGYAGGLAGSCEGTIQRCISNARVESTDATMSCCGGIAGWLKGSASECAIYGQVAWLGKNSGGLVGGCDTGASLTNCFYNQTTGVTYTPINLCGGTTRPTISRCYERYNYDGQITVQVSEAVDSLWNAYWAVAPNMNDGLPLQKSLYWLADHSSTMAEITQSLGNYTLF